MSKKKVKVEIEEIVFETRRIVCRDERLAGAFGLALMDGGRQTAETGWMRPWERRVTAAMAAGISAALIMVWIARWP